MKSIVEKTKWLRRGYPAFVAVIASSSRPVVLLEGSRDLPAEVQAVMARLAEQVMKAFPTRIARSGNADGSDQAWARGVNAVAPERLQLILPVPGYKRGAWADGNQTLALQEAPAEYAVAARELTREHYTSGRRSGAAAYDGLPDYKQNYLDRDALKVLGVPDYRGRQQKAAAALFYLNPSKPGGGGTGHTLRLCEAKRVPYFLSEDWLGWSGEIVTSTDP